MASRCRGSTCGGGRSTADRAGEAARASSGRRLRAICSGRVGVKGRPPSLSSWDAALPLFPAPRRIHLGHNHGTGSLHGHGPPTPPGTWKAKACWSSSPQCRPCTLGLSRKGG